MSALVKAGEQRPVPQQPTPQHGGSGQQQYLTFQLGSEMFATGILCVKEIIEYGELTAVPMMPECIRGVINLRGAVVPIVDLACRFGRPSAPLSRRTCIVIIEAEGEGGQQDIGVVVDAVSEVLEIQDGEIEPAPAFGARIRTDFIRGMGKVEGRFVIILDVDQVLSLDDLALLGQLAGQDAVDAAAAAA